MNEILLIILITFGLVGLILGVVYIITDGEAFITITELYEKTASSQCQKLILDDSGYYCIIGDTAKGVLFDCKGRECRMIYKE